MQMISKFILVALLGTLAACSKDSSGAAQNELLGGWRMNASATEDETTYVISETQIRNYISYQSSSKGIGGQAIQESSFFDMKYTRNGDLIYLTYQDADSGKTQNYTVRIVEISAQKMVLELVGATKPETKPQRVVFNRLSAEQTEKIQAEGNRNSFSEVEMTSEGDQLSIKNTEIRSSLEANSAYLSCSYDETKRLSFSLSRYVKNEKNELTSSDSISLNGQVQFDLSKDTEKVELTDRMLWISTTQNNYSGITESSNCSIDLSRSGNTVKASVQCKNQKLDRYPKADMAITEVSVNLGWTVECTPYVYQSRQPN